MILMKNGYILWYYLHVSYAFYHRAVLCRQIKNIHDLYTVIKNKFSSDTINISMNCLILNEEMLSVESDSELIAKDAKIIESWSFE